MESIRRIIFYKDYFTKFYVEQAEDVRKKINQVLMFIQSQQRVPAKFLKHIESTAGLYEIRVELAGNIYRIFCCFDEGQLVVLFNAFQKKAQKTPQTEISKALKIMNEYFKNKQI
ncbi:MAG: type II toxin-antitoxin system RelE/ParE family toxin [Paludibacteraceae bacterium]|nr:type II toxin-antitoxin system RelE/ParE family toxin [Paludibacteraceae bacterium]